MSEPKVNAHLTVVETVYYQPFGENPLSIGSSFGRRLQATDEQAYQRTVKVGEEWQAIDFGWIKSVGMVVLRNEGRPQGLTQPEPETGEAIIEVGALDIGADWLILPGESMRGMPAGSLRARCRNGVVRLTIIAIPA